jgi:hypothetical protein
MKMNTEWVDEAAKPRAQGAEQSPAGLDGLSSTSTRSLQTRDGTGLRKTTRASANTSGPNLTGVAAMKLRTQHPHRTKKNRFFCWTVLTAGEPVLGEPCRKSSRLT